MGMSLAAIAAMPAILIKAIPRLLQLQLPPCRDVPSSWPSFLQELGVGGAL